MQKCAYPICIPFAKICNNRQAYQPADCYLVEWDFLRQAGPSPDVRPSRQTHLTPSLSRYMQIRMFVSHVDSTIEDGHTSKTCIRMLCKAGCRVVFDNNKCDMYYNDNTDLWTLTIVPTPKKVWTAQQK